MPRYTITRLPTRALAGGQDAALAVEMVRARPPHDQYIHLDDPALQLLNQLSPIPWATLLKTPARVRWMLLTCFTDPWGQNQVDDAVGICGCCGGLVFHDRASIRTP